MLSPQKNDQFTKIKLIRLKVFIFWQHQDVAFLSSQSFPAMCLDSRFFSACFPRLYLSFFFSNCFAPKPKKKTTLPRTNLTWLAPERWCLENDSCPFWVSAYFQGRAVSYTTLRIIGPSKLAILRTLPLLYRFKPFHWRVQDP